MKLLWPFVALPVYIAAMIVIVGCLYVAGSVVGEALEYLIRGTPSFLYSLPHHGFNAMAWLSTFFNTAISNPLRTVCIILGMLLVLTYFRGVAGHFGGATSTFRGSTVRTAEDIFPDLDDNSMDDPSMYSPQFRGSSIEEFDSLFNTPPQSLWSKLWDKIKAPFTRHSGGDDLL